MLLKMERYEHVEGKPYKKTMASSGVELVNTKVNGLHLFNCHNPHGKTIPQYEQMLDRLMLDAKDHSPKIIAENYKAWVFEWRSGAKSVVCRMNEYNTNSDI